MEVKISNELIIKKPSKELIDWTRCNLIIENPEYSNRLRRGQWIGNTSQYISLYHVDGENLILPCGVGKQIRQYLSKDINFNIDLADNGILEFDGNIPLYDYQEPAVVAMKKYGCGILKAPCGSGKTQMGIALAKEISRKTLWVTHTQDLLNQSYERAAQYFDKKLLGKITGGNVQIGSHITFATVQTLSKLDLNKYKYVWDVVIVDECHRLAGTPSSVTMFYKVLSSLAARYKFGLSATVHRSDGLIKSTFAVIGDIAYQVPDESVKEKTMTVNILKRDTGIVLTDNCRCLDTDGTLIYTELLPYLTENITRNQLIVNDLIKNKDNYNLILSDRLEHLKTLQAMLPLELKEVSSMIDGKMTSKRARAERVRAIDDLKSGKKNYLFASYSLAKEGLDIPRLNRLYLTTPKKDYAVVTQSIGRIARVFEGKSDAVCYDYVDSIGFCENQYKRRKTSYRKAGCEFI
jgi:superfamily II DNA or RNA helicase